MSEPAGRAPLGRGALIAAALKAKEARAREQHEDEPPKPRGRAALIAQQLRDKKLSKVGSEPSQPPSTESSSSSKPDESVARLTHKVSELNLDKPPVEYKGVSGEKVPASANYISLKQQPNRGIFEYEVKFSPDVDAKSARGRMVHKALDTVSKGKIFDGHILYLSERVIDTEQDFHCEHPFNNVPIIVTVIFKKQKPSSECLHLYNVLFKRIMMILEYKRVGRQFFDNKNPFVIPQHKLEIWPGYVVSVNEYSGGIMLCLDVQHRVLRTQNALELIHTICDMNRERYKQLVEKAFIGSVVLTRYNNKTYIVHDIIWNANPQSRFTLSDGSTLSFIEYYKRQYNINLRDHEQPMLVNRQSLHVAGKAEKDDRLLMLVPELCFLTGLTDEMRSDFRVMKDIAMYTRVTPNQRMNSLRKFTENVHQIPEASEILSNWGLTLDKATIDLQMRVLEPEMILFGNDVKFHGTAQADWTSAAMKNCVLLSIDLHNWLLIHTAQDRRQADDFVQAICRLGGKMGIKIVPPARVCIPDDRNDSYMKVLKERIIPELQLVCVICPTNRDDRYTTIKKICCSKFPIASQVIMSRTLRNPSKLPAITQKIALQMNCKLGGSLWSVRFPIKKWMICGIDVHHSKAFKGQAVCGLVCSLNDTISKWYSRCCFHERDLEISSHLKIMFCKAIQEFYNENAYYPAQVVIYRDGVGDGQLNTCLNVEIPQLKSVFQDLNIDTKLMYIIVQKRINTRIFLMNRNIDNPTPGSIVDDQITRRNLYDFFLVAQQVRQGTVTPTHYIVLYDEANIKPDHVQRLSYKMCHMYYNWTGTVRVPAPCQYAHKLAYLVGQNIRSEPSIKLASTLFYL